MPELKFSSEKEKPKFARVTDVIKTSEQEYVDTKKRYAHNDLYPTAVVEVIKIEGEKVLVKDNTGEFWIPKEKLEF
ncbi:MAG: hypothetical protein PHS62_00665 [Patescibacteria group bacterium]|nr:hypothetical protein [Patescibacteria group bacterium]